MELAGKRNNSRRLQNRWSKLTSQIYYATAGHDILRFKAALDRGFSPWTLFSQDWTGSHPIEVLEAQTKERPFSKPVSLLELAVRCNFLPAVEFLIRSTAVPTVPAFYWACRLGLNAMARLLWTAAVDAGKNGAVAKYFKAMIKYDRINLATELIEVNTFDPNKKLIDSSLNSPKTLLHVCVEHDVTQVLSRLLVRGARTDDRDGDGYSPLNLALFLGHYDCCRCLLRHGANTDYTVYLGDTPVNMSLYELYESYPSEARGGGADSMARLLVRAGIDLTGQKWLLGKDADEASRGALGVDVRRTLTMLCCRPTSLQMICFRFVRRHLSRVGRGTSILDKIERLPVPLLIKAEMRLDG